MVGCVRLVDATSGGPTVDGPTPPGDASAERAVGLPSDLASADLASADPPRADLAVADLGPPSCTGEPTLGDEDGDGLCGCDEPSALADDFGDGTLGEAWNGAWTNDGASREESGGRLTLVLPAGEPGASAGVATTKPFTVRGEAVWVEAPQQADDASEATLALASGDDEIGLGRDRATLRCWARLAGPFVDLASEPYDPAAHRFWRLAVDGAGKPSCAVSADGKSWRTLATAQSLALDTATFRLQAYARGALLGARVSFDNLNVAPSGASHVRAPRDGRWAPCPASTLVDGFDDGVAGLRWSAWGDGAATVEQAAGALQVSTTGGAGFAGYTSRGVFTLAGSMVRVEIKESSIEQALQLTDDEHWLRIKRDGDGTLRAAHGDSTSGATVGEVVYSPAVHRYWSIREQSGEVFWETSPDGASWTELASVTLALEPWYRVALFAGRDQPGAAGVARFDNLNLLP